MKRFAQAAALVLMLLPSTGKAQDSDLGLKAFMALGWDTALRELPPLAEQGNSDAAYYLGDMYTLGLGVPQDSAEAVKWYRLAADQGDPEAQLQLGSMYDFGLGVAKDYTEAVKWYRLAADQGDAKGQFRLGSMYENGWGVPQDYITAHMWFNISSAKGESYATERRDRVAAILTPAGLSEAQRRARVCMASNYQDCD